SSYVLGNLSKHIVLEEGFAWLSTLGGAHSSLGETFQHHAERAGEISGHQLRLAIQLGNESLIARCYVFWSWSLMQRGYLGRCKLCILNTWRFCKTLKCRDRVLENMCKAVWSRLRYRRALRQGMITTRQPNGCGGNIIEFRDDSSDSETESDRIQHSFISGDHTSTTIKVEQNKGQSNPDLASQSKVFDGKSNRVVCGNWHQHHVTLAKNTSQRFRPLSPTIEVW
ncbi:hypothetical protein ElyMa_005340800, partial [Elysia marginata]